MPRVPRRFFAYGLLFSLPALAGYRGELLANEAAIELARELVERQNHGRQLIVQISEHALADIVLAKIAPRSDLLRWQPSAAEAATLGGSPDLWVSDLDMTLADGNMLHVVATLRGRFDGQRGTDSPPCALGLDSGIGGTALIDVPLTVETNSCGAPTQLTGAPSIGVVDLDFSGCIDILPFQESFLETVFWSQLDTALRDFSLDISSMTDMISEEEFTCADDAFKLPELAPRNVGMRTLLAPLDANGDVTEPVLMIGVDLMGPSAHYVTATCETCDNGTDDDDDGYTDCADVECATDVACTGLDSAADTCPDTGLTEVPGLPNCYADLADSGDYTLFDPDAFDSYNQSLIAENRDLTVAISTRLLRRLEADLIWQAAFEDKDGVVQTLAHTFGDMLQEAAATPTLIEHDQYTEWGEGGGGFTTQYPIPDEPTAYTSSDDIAMAELCATDAAGAAITEIPAAVSAEGAWILDATEGNPRFHSRAYMYHVYWVRRWYLPDFSVTTNVSVDIRTRYFIDNQDSLAPRLAKDIRVETAALGCGGSCLTESGREIDAALDAVRSSIDEGSTTFFTLGTDSDGVAIAFDLMDTYQATIAVSGKLRTVVEDDSDLSLSDSDVAEPVEAGDWQPAVGAIVGLNVDEPTDPLVSAGFNPVQLQCPPGYASRYVDFSESANVVLTACEYVDAGNAGSETDLPPFAWCGLGINSKHPDEDLFTSTCGGLNPRRSCPPGFRQFSVWLAAEDRACFDPATPCLPSIREADIITCLADGSGWSDAWVDDLPPGLISAARWSGASGALRGFTSCPLGFSEVVQTATTETWLSLTECAATGDWEDTDHDGLVDSMEADVGSDPDLRSTDGDVFSDGFEVSGGAGLDFASDDTDGDKLPDFSEVFVFETDPTNADSDSDGLSDGFEVWVAQWDPLDAYSQESTILDGDLDAAYYLLLESSWYTDSMTAEDGTSDWEGEGFDSGGGLGEGE